jgi:threonine/homoserine efflux transporter RhtA
VVQRVHPFSFPARIPSEMTTREYGLLGGLAIVTLLMPIVALLLGALVLGEPVTATALAGMALICAGLLAIDGRVLRTRRAAVDLPRPRSKAA